MQKEKFKENVLKAKEVFKILWKKLKNGFDKNGNIKGLEQYYLDCGWEDSARDLSLEKGELSILNLSIYKNDKEYISFNYHHYGGHTKLDKKTDLRDIYLLFAEILSACFGYTTFVHDEYYEKDYCVFFDHNGKKYVLAGNRSDYIRAHYYLITAQKEIAINQERLSEAEGTIALYENKLLDPNE